MSPAKWHSMDVGCQIDLGRALNWLATIYLITQYVIQLWSSVSTFLEIQPAKTGKKEGR